MTFVFVAGWHGEPCPFRSLLEDPEPALDRERQPPVQIDVELDGGRAAVGRCPAEPARSLDAPDAVHE